MRAERCGTGNGRIDTVIHRATDVAGNTGYASATVVVPKGLADK